MNSRKRIKILNLVIHVLILNNLSVGKSWEQIVENPLVPFMCRSEYYRNMGENLLKSFLLIKDYRLNQYKYVTTITSRCFSITVVERNDKNKIYFYCNQKCRADIIDIIEIVKLLKHFNFVQNKYPVLIGYYTSSWPLQIYANYLANNNHACFILGYGSEAYSSGVVNSFKQHDEKLTSFQVFIKKDRAIDPSNIPQMPIYITNRSLTFTRPRRSIVNRIYPKKASLSKYLLNILIFYLMLLTSFKD